MTNSQAGEPNELEQAPGPQRPQLRVGTRWSYIDVLSDPIVVYTARGYAPVIAVDRGGIEHILYISARSMSVALNKLYQEYGTLVGLSLRLRKESAEKFAGYEVEVVS